MAFVWTWLGGYQAAVTVFSLGVAALVLAVRPDRFQNRCLALMLAMFGLMGFGSQGLIQLTNDRELATASQVLLVSLSCAFNFVYVAFVGTLDTPLARPFAGRGVRTLLLLLAAAGGLAGGPLTDRLVLDLVRLPVSGVWRPVYADAATLLWYEIAAVVLYGFLAAVSMFRRTRPGTALRKQATAYALAFGIRDVWYMAALLAIPAVVGSPALTVFLLYQFPSLTFVFTALLGYGILRHQMFGIDLRLKWAISRTTIAAAFLAAFFVGTVMAENFLTARYGWVLGGVAAGLLLFALAPLQRLARGLSDRVLPGVEDTPKYAEFRKFEIYKAALEGAAQDRAITEKERAMLESLRKKLAIAAPDAAAMERDVLRAGQGHPV